MPIRTLLPERATKTTGAGAVRHRLNTTDCHKEGPTKGTLKSNCKSKLILQFHSRRRKSIWSLPSCLHMYMLRHIRISDLTARILKTPMFLRVLCDPAPEDPNYDPLPEERPGGFDWGNDAGDGADGNAVPLANVAEGEDADIQDGEGER